jgi:hypothetical protein
MNVALPSDPPEERFCLVFREDLKPMVLNTTNARLIAGITGSEETDDWHGHEIVLYNDPTIAYAGKIVGGIRVRAPKKQPARPAPGKATAPAPAPAPAPVEQAEDEDEEVPF